MTNNDETFRVYITYDTHPETFMPINVKLYKSRPKHRFFYDSKLVSKKFFNDRRLILSVVQYVDGGQTKYEFYDIQNNIETIRANIEHFYNYIKSYSKTKSLKKISLLEGRINE